MKKYVIEWEQKTKMVCILEDESDADFLLDDVNETIQNWEPNYARIMGERYGMPVLSYEAYGWTEPRIRLATDEDLEGENDI